MLLLFEIHQNCGSQTLILLWIAIFRNWSNDCQIKFVAPITVILKHFKACIFQTVGSIFMKFLPSNMLPLKLMWHYQTISVYIQNFLWKHNTMPFQKDFLPLLILPIFCFVSVAEQAKLKHTWWQVLGCPLKLKIRRNNWLLADTCPQAANHCALSWVWEWVL